MPVFSFDYQGMILGLCRGLVDSGCVDVAVRHLEGLREIFPGSLAPMEMLGRCYGRAGRTGDARIVLERLLALHPYHRGAHVALLELPLPADPAGAARLDGHIDTALRTWPFDEEIVLLAARALRELGTVDRSRAVLEGYVGTGYRAGGRAHVALAECILEQDGAESLAGFLSGTDWGGFPMTHEARVRLAGLYVEAGDPEDAMFHLTEGLSAPSPSPAALAAASTVLERMGRTEDAWNLSYNLLVRNGVPEAGGRCLRLERDGTVRSAPSVLPPRRGRPLVVFVSERPRMREAQFADALRTVGFDVALLYGQTPHYDVAAYFAEAVRFRNPPHALYLARRYRPLAYHVFSMGGDPTSYLLTKEKPGRIVFDPNDIFEGGNGCDPSDTLSIQRYCLEKADALCFRDRQPALVRARHGYSLPFRNVLMEEYCWRRHPLPEIADEPPADSPIHIVSIGFFNIEKLLPGRVGYLEVARRLAAHGVHFHLYPTWFYCDASESQWADDLEEYIRLDREAEFFHLHRPVPVERLIPEICRYDFAITADQSALLPPRRSHLPPPILATCGSSRLTDYIEAGLPVIITRNLAFQFRKLSRMGIAIEAGPDFLDRPREILSAFRTAEIRKKVREARKKEDIMRHIPRLAAFYRSLG